MRPTSHLRRALPTLSRRIPTILLHHPSLSPSTASCLLPLHALSSSRSLYLASSRSLAIVTSTTPLSCPPPVLRTMSTASSDGHATLSAKPLKDTLESTTSGSVSDPLVVYVTAPSAEVAGQLAKGIVSGQLAACVNIVNGLTSVYAWKGKIESDSEVLMIIKTTQERLKALHAYVLTHHPYDTPEFITLPVTAGSAAYLGWLREQVTPLTSSSSSSSSTAASTPAGGVGSN